MEMIGFVGLGRMGRPMSSNLCRKGFRLVVHDINRDAVAELELLQARGAESVAAVARESGIIVTMLPNSAIVDQVIAGLDGVLAHAKPGSLRSGRMGRPMSSNLCRKGFRLVVHDINRDAVAELELLQARGAESVAAVARESGIIVTMLPNSAIVDQVIAGLDGVLAHAKPGSL